MKNKKNYSEMTYTEWINEMQSVKQYKEKKEMLKVKDNICMKEYHKEHKKFKNGEITVEEWTEYTLGITQKLLENHKEVFERLKYS